MNDQTSTAFDAAMKTLERLEVQARADTTEPQARQSDREQPAPEHKTELLPPRWQLRVKA
jgi:hypothetical protein